MAKYKLILYWSNGTVDEDDNDGDFFNSEEEANDYGLYLLSCESQGAEILGMSNPGDYPYDPDDYVDSYFEIEEV